MLEWSRPLSLNSWRRVGELTQPLGTSVNVFCLSHENTECFRSFLLIGMEKMALTRSKAIFSVSGVLIYWSRNTIFGKAVAIETTTFWVCISLLPFASIQGCNLESGNSLWQRRMLGERLSCESSTANTPSSWKNECISPEGAVWATHHSIHYKQALLVILRHNKVGVLSSGRAPYLPQLWI